jgi:hypothetical protein
MHAETCYSLTGCFMYSQATVGDAHGYKILAFQAIWAVRSLQQKISIWAFRICVNRNIFSAGTAGFVRTGDTVIVHSMHRLARNLDDLRSIVQTLTQRGVCNYENDI